MCSSDLKNLSKREFLRIQAALLEAKNEIYNLRKELNSNQKTLKNLLSTTEYVYLKIEMDSLLFPSPENINIMLLTEKAFEENPEINIMKLQTQYYDKSIKYEKSLRIPDLNFNVSYDRGGDIWRDFVGFGVGIDIPVFNRNQGAIKAAQISAEQSRYQYKQEENILKNNITESFLNYSESYNIYEKVRKNDLTENLDEMLDLFTKNILNKNISMIEYMDFMDSFKQTKDIILSSIKDTIQPLEELKYYTSTEILD